MVLAEIYFQIAVTFSDYHEYIRVGALILLYNRKFQDNEKNHI